MQHALEFLSHHQAEPEIWNTEKISSEYKLSKEITEQILKHFHIFEVFIPKASQSEVQRHLGKVTTILEAAKMLSPAHLKEATEKSVKKVSEEWEQAEKFLGGNVSKNKK